MVGESKPGQGEPKPDEGYRTFDRGYAINKIAEINAGWEIEDPVKRDEGALRKMEDSVSLQFAALLDSDMDGVSAESDPELLAAVKEAIRIFDNITHILLFKEVEAKMEGREFTPEEWEKETRLPLPEELE